MLDLGHIPSESGASDVQIFYGNSPAVGQMWQTWAKPRGKTMLDILLIGKGGNGGTGVVGANSTAAGGGGGGSGAQTRLTIPLALLPDILYLSLAGQSATAPLASYITIQPTQVGGGGLPIANNVLASAGGGGNGGAGTGAVGGTGPTGTAAGSAASMPLGWAYATSLAGMTGSVGGTTGNAPTLTQSVSSVTGLLVTSGTGGGGLPAAASTGSLGGAFTANGAFPLRAPASAVISATVPPGNGENGYQPIPKLLYLYGGIGGGSTHGTATGAGLVQSVGGNGAYGCGGGGNGGALTGSTAASTVGQGGAAIAILTCW